MTAITAADRNARFRRIAQAQNRVAWAKSPPETDARVLAIIPKLEESADRQQARYIEARRERLVKAVRETAENPGLFWRHRYFRDLLAGVVLSTDEACSELAYALAKEARRKGHWSHNPHRLPQLREALVFARYFRRHGKQLWMREAA